MAQNVINSFTQLSLFAQDATGEKSKQNGNTPIARLSTYLKTREALFRLIATYPQRMSVEDAVRRARIDFTKRKKGGAA